MTETFFDEQTEQSQVKAAIVAKYFDAWSRVRVEDVIAQHHVGTPFVDKNYKAALSRLEAAGAVKIDPPAEKRRMLKGVRTLSDNAVVDFSIVKNDGR